MSAALRQTEGYFLPVNGRSRSLFLPRSARPHPAIVRTAPHETRIRIRIRRTDAPETRWEQVIRDGAETNEGPTAAATDPCVEPSDGHNYLLVPLALVLLLPQPTTVPKMPRARTSATIIRFI